MATLSKLTIILGFAVIIAIAQAYQSVQYMGIPIPIYCLIIAFSFQWLAFVPALLLRTEKFYDLTGGLTYISIGVLALALIEEKSLRAIILTSMIVIWAGRLGLFLFSRVLKDNGDSRFNAIKSSAPRFLLTWSIQGLWVVVTASAAIAAISSSSVKSLIITDYLAIFAWTMGFLIETIADFQKRKFRELHGKHDFITTGLWKYSRHPNYFGEILLWSGVALLSAPVLVGWQMICLVSPIFVYLLLTRVSGIPLLEAKSESKWGHTDKYKTYFSETSQLVPMPKKSRRSGH